MLYIGSPISPEKKVTKYVNEKDELILESILEQQVAEQAFQKGEMTGLGTEKTSQNCLGTYIPFSNKDRIYGVLGLLFSENGYIENDALQFANFMTSQTILAIDRQEIVDESQKILLEKEKENMRSNLLRAISHDLRTPLTGILGASSAILENGERISSQARQQLIQDIREDADWLLRMVENVLSVTRIGPQASGLRKVPEAVEEVIAQAVNRCRKRLPGLSLTVRVPEEFVMAPMDSTLIEQVLINLIENAYKYGRSAQPVEVTVCTAGENVRFVVQDHGPGIAPELLPVLFEGFLGRDGQSADSSRGLGIGLSICRSIITAHGGTIQAENRPGGGAQFVFTLPLEEEASDA